MLRIFHHRSASLAITRAWQLPHVIFFPFLRVVDFAIKLLNQSFLRPHETRPLAPFFFSDAWLAPSERVLFAFRTTQLWG